MIEQQIGRSKCSHVCCCVVYVILKLVYFLLWHRNTVDKYATGANYKQELIKEEARLSVLRDKMIADMEHKGVNPKYLGEMKGVDIRKMLNR